MWFLGKYGSLFLQLPSYSIPDGQEGLRGSNLEKAGCCFFQMGLFDFCRPERSYRESAPSGAVPATAGAIGAWRPQAPFRRPTAAPGGGSWAGDGRSSVLHRRKGDDERGHTLSSEDLRPAAVGLTSFVGRCPAACRRVILLSSPKEESRKQRKKCHRLGWTFSGIPPRVLLLSSLKEVSKKGATVSTRWTPTREQSPLDPAQRKTIKCRFHRLLPGPPCGPGVQVFPQRKK